MSELTMRVITETKEFELMREPWDKTLARSSDNNIYLTWEWLFTWWKHYGGDKKLNIVAIEDENKIIGIVPLMQSKYGKSFLKFDVLENICSVDCDYSGIILTEKKEDSLDTFIRYLKEIVSIENVIVRISQIAENSDFLSLLRKKYPSFVQFMILNERIMTSCPYLSLPKTWDEYLLSLHRKRRKNLRRALQSLKKNHDVELKKYNSNENLKEQMQVLFELHQKRWETKNLSSRFSHQEERELCIDVSTIFSQNGWLDLSFLTVDDKVASAVWGFKYNREFYYMTPTFDPDYSDYSIGNLHVMLLIEDLINDGIRIFDFLKGDELYKRYWTRSSKNNVQVVLMKKTFAADVRLRLFYKFMRLNEISKRSLLENYRLFQDVRKEHKAMKLMARAGE